MLGLIACQIFKENINYMNKLSSVKETIIFKIQKIR